MSTQQTPIIEQVEIDGDQIQQVIFDNLMPALDNVPIGLAITAMLGFSTLLMKPDISPDGLSEVLGETSKFLVMLLSSVDAASEINKVTLN